MTMTTTKKTPKRTRPPKPRPLKQAPAAPASPPPPPHGDSEEYININNNINLKDDIKNELYVFDCNEEALEDKNLISNTHAPTPTTQKHDDNDDNDDNPLHHPLVNLNQPFTPQEKKFLAYYLSRAVSRTKALQLAGYKTSRNKDDLALANRILEKHVRRVDLKQILRAIGLSEIRVAKMVLQIAEDLGNTAKTRLAALELAAKMLAMTREEQQTFDGAEIWIEAAAAGPGPGDQGQDQAQAQAKVAVKAKVRTVTR